MYNSNKGRRAEPDNMRTEKDATGEEFVSGRLMNPKQRFSESVHDEIKVHNTFVSL